MGELQEEEEGWKSHNYVVLSYPGCKKNKIYFFLKIVQIEKQRFCGEMKWSLVPLPGATCIFFFFFFL